jgi:SET domain-containing protein
VKKILASGKIYIGKSKIGGDGGRGVFADTTIKKGEIIEICPVIQIPEHDLANLKESILVTYFFFFGKNNNNILVSLGFGSIYNHSRTPNAKYVIAPDQNVMKFIALKEIEKDEEITFHYNSLNPKSNIPLWFEAKN